MGERMAATKKFPDGRMRMSSSSHNQHDEENNPQTEINTGLRKRPAHTEETRNTDNDSSVEKRTNASLFDCHICFDSPNDPVVTPCGHLYCWSCIYKWMVAHPECPSCPLCKSSIDKDKQKKSRKMFARFASQASRRTGRRMFSGESHEAEHAEITALWKKRTLIAIPLVGALALANVVIHFSHGHHEHEHDKPLFSYQKKLVKKYPWAAHDCNLFDYECKAHYYEKAAGKGHH